jgi:uncharacterized secreted protein with C-terminal beta-propeller domain
MGGKIAIPLSDLPATATAASQPTATGSTSSYSTTNVQVKGVDEGDLVKTDGNHIYLARGSRFLVLKGQPVQQAAVVSNIDLAETINELYLADGRVTVITAPYNLASTTPAVSLLAGTSGEMVAFPVSGEDFAATGSIVPWIPTTRVYNYDVSNPAKPILLSRFDFPGSLLGSRRINNSMYLIINHHIDLPAAVSIGDYLPAGNSTPELYRKASEMAFAENLRRIDIMTLGDMIPSYSRIIYNEGRAGTAVKNQVVESNDIYIPTSGNGTDLTMVIVLDTATAPPVVTSSGVVSASSQMYMSPESLYLASSNSWAWIQPVRDMLLPAGNPEPWTALHKFALGNGASKPLYKGSGLVAGWVNNQFSMGEHNSYLRIGTTRGGWWGEKISNRLAIFAEQNGSLSEKGHIEGLAEGEKIYSMRFDKNRGYMVTFRQTDPLFTFDLSDPQNPKKIGELKVNGFATYIHLVGQDNNRLLTVGRSADAAGRVTGNKLQLFDVTDLYSPALLGDVELGDGWSDALYDHHAFLYYDPLGILAIPYYKYGSTADRYSSGLRVFTVTGNGISERGMITAQAVSYGYGTYNDTVDRSIIIGTDIYAIAHRTVTIAGSELLDIKNIVGLPEGYGYYALPVSTGKISPDQ